MTLRWGILGCGGIAERFALSLREAKGARLTAVAARSRDKAEDFKRRFGAERAYGDETGVPDGPSETAPVPGAGPVDAASGYARLAFDPAIDIVYIATTHNFHLEHALLCLRAGKHVLCEKPLALSEREGQRMAEEARDRGLFLLEAVWTVFHPATRAWLKLLEDGVLGDLRQVQANFGIQVPRDPENRWFNPALAGGALLDLGIYPLTLARLAFGADPVEVLGRAHLGPSGVDEHSEYLLSYPGGRSALLSSSFTFPMPHEARLFGTEGHLVLPDFFHAKGFTLHRKGRSPEEFSHPYRSTGYVDEAEEAMDCIRRGLTESPLLPLSHSLGVLRTMDALRAGFGLRYPGEEERGDAAKDRFGGV